MTKTSPLVSLISAEKEGLLSTRRPLEAAVDRAERDRRDAQSRLDMNIGAAQFADYLAAKLTAIAEADAAEEEGTG